MFHPRNQSPQDQYDWRLVSEFLLGGRSESEAESMEQVSTSLSQIGLEPRQVDQIISYIEDVLEDLQESQASLQIRISVSGLDFIEPQPGDDTVQQGTLGLAGSGLGFFLVKRAAGQREEPGKQGLLEVLIYGEPSRKKD